jgi:hypothetical protein
MNDSVTSEMHRIKDAIAREHRNDVRAILDYARQKFPLKAVRPVRRRSPKKLPA